MISAVRIKRLCTRLARAIALRASASTCRASAALTCVIKFALSLSRSTCESGPCSAWLSKSAATISLFASLSAITKTSLGPAGISMAAPSAVMLTCSFASVTHAFPGPNNLSHFGTLSVPNAIAAIACTPPSLKTRLMPQSLAA